MFSSLNPKKKALFLSAIVGVAGFAGSYFLGHAGVPKTTDVLVAATEIRAGQVLSVSDVSTVKVKGQGVPGVLSNPQDVAGKVARYDVAPGAPLTKEDISDKAQRDGLFPGEVGIWVGTDLTSGGMVEPGQRVDVLLGGNAAVSRALLQNVRVVRAVNGSGQSSTQGRKQPNLNTPIESAGVAAAVELAIPAAQEADFARTVSNSKVILADAPWPPGTNAAPTPPVQPGQPQQRPPQQAGQQQPGQPQQANQTPGQSGNQPTQQPQQKQ